jgi:hypothetical protein
MERTETCTSTTRKGLLTGFLKAALGLIIFLTLTSAPAGAGPLFSIKSHTYSGLENEAIHQYHFRGYYPDPYYTSDPLLRVEFDVEGYHNMKTREFREIATVQQCSGETPNHSLWRRKKYVTEGTMINDPWLFPTFPLGSAQTTCQMDEVFYKSSGKLHSWYPVPYSVQPPKLYSRNFFSEEERAALYKEKPTPTYCTAEQIKKPPRVIQPPAYDGHYPDIEKVTLHFEMDCIPQPADNGFYYHLEEGIAQSSGPSHWIRHCDRCAVSMTSSGYHYTTKGVVTTSLPANGRYRIQIYQRAQTPNGQVKGDPTKWIYFTAGPLKTEPAITAQKKQAASPAPTGTPTAQPKASSKILVASLPRPEVVVQSVQINPAQPKAGQSLDLKTVLWNKGTAPTGTDQKYTARFTSQSGSPVLWSPGPYPVGQVIQPNQLVTLTKQFEIKTAGNYEVLVKAEPGSGEKKVSFTVLPVTSVIPKPGVMKR